MERDFDYLKKGLLSRRTWGTGIHPGSGSTDEINKDIVNLDRIMRSKYYSTGNVVEGRIEGFVQLRAGQIDAERAASKSEHCNSRVTVLENFELIEQQVPEVGGCRIPYKTRYERTHSNKGVINLKTPTRE
jgi:hypothetical protein